MWRQAGILGTCRGTQSASSGTQNALKGRQLEVKTPMSTLDTETLAALRSLQEDGEDDLLAELIDLFLEDAPERLDAIRQAVDASDWAGLAERAHSLKGSCASLGAVHMASLCARLEAMGRDLAQRTDVADVYGELAREYARVQEALLRERNGSL
jgi:HPt (histidine-containing phosphotransfer) domain-containing protein